MQFLKQEKIQVLIAFIVTILFTLLIVASVWSRTIENKNLGAWPLIFLALALAGSLYSFMLYRKAFNSELIEGLIQENVEKVKTDLLAEFEKKEEEVINIEENIDEIVKRIMPKGSFKGAASYAEKLLKALSDELQASIGIFYLAKGKKYSYLAGFALPDDPPPDFKEGENLNGQVAVSKEIMIVDNIPEDYFTIESALGKSKPKTLIIAPILNKNTTIAILEFATFIESDQQLLKVLNKVSALAAEKLIQIQKS